MPTKKTSNSQNTMAVRMYGDLMARCLTDTIYGAERKIVRRGKEVQFDAKKREAGRDWPVVGHSMIGMHRMQNLIDLTIRVLDEGIPGDVIETGVWRGGASALMRGLIKAWGDTDRRVFVADSFEGLPPPDPRYPADSGSRLHTRGRLAVSLEQVQKTFQSYGLLDDQVVFVKGWFKDTLHLIETKQFSLIRLDGDMYESTIQAIEALYPRLAAGGFIIVDDYGGIKACAKAINDYRDAHCIDDEIVEIDHTGIWWQKSEKL